MGQPPKWLALGLETWDGSTFGPISWWLNFLTHTQLTENDSQVEGLGPEAKHQRLGVEMAAVDRGIFQRRIWNRPVRNMKSAGSCLYTLIEKDSFPGFPPPNKALFSVLDTRWCGFARAYCRDPARREDEGARISGGRGGG